ncbi:hypothetical protein [Streptomyces sp. CBMA152]|uniref:hypothetical protein n=1 Tax=Streptomyces sp. CBMA152 TaxID=1896312 RepID=UPI00166168B1|nr:hypothetical protein [Streptomyces sp. CBMA152]MBD0745622.1 hypothetical protein [Streptomyces sp. CBMA152]
MAESDGISRPSGDRAGRAGRDPEDRPRPYEPPEEPDGPAGLPPGPDDLPGLLAALGTHLERHSADELVVLLRAELENRELRAYAAGWRDAAAQYQRALDETASAARARSLRRAGRRPGRGEVIPLRRDLPQQAESRTPPAADEIPGGAAVEHGRTPEPDTAPDAAPERDPGRPGLVRKSPHSKVPTIPRLTAPRRERGKGGAEPPEEGPG